MQHIKRENQGLRRTRATITVVPMLAVFWLGCAADPEVGGEATTTGASTSDPTGAGSSTDGADGQEATATVEDVGELPLCAPSPSHQELDDHSWLFHAKYRLELVPGSYPVIPGGGLPYALEVQGEAAMTTKVDDEQNAFTVVPGKWRDGEGGGEIDDDLTQQSLVFDEIFQIEPPVVDPWLGEVSEGSIHVVTSMPVGGEPVEFVIDESAVVRLGGVGTMAACGENRPAPALTQVELGGGAVDFETVPGSIATRAVGEVEGLAFDVSDYFDLDYSSWRPNGGYLDDPMFAVRLSEEGPLGECALYVFLPNDADNTVADAEAWWLDCDGARLREIDVTGFDITLPGA